MKKVVLKKNLADNSYGIVYKDNSRGCVSKLEYVNQPAQYGIAKLDSYDITGITPDLKSLLLNLHNQGHLVYSFNCAEDVVKWLRLTPFDICVLNTVEFDQNEVDVSNVSNELCYSVEYDGDLGFIVCDRYRTGNYQAHVVSDSFTIGNQFNVGPRLNLANLIELMIKLNYTVYEFNTPLDMFSYITKQLAKKK
jgi:hypothetical protein